MLLNSGNSREWVVDGADTHEMITFGPLCVEPKWQGCGVVIEGNMEDTAEMLRGVFEYEEIM